MAPRPHIPFQFVERKGGFRIIAGEPIDIATVRQKGIRLGAQSIAHMPYSLTYIQLTGHVGTHGTIDFSVKPIRNLLEWVKPRRIIDPELSSRVRRAIARNELVGHIEGRGVPRQYQSRPEQLRSEKLNIGKRLWGRAIRHLREQGVKLVFASTGHDNALKSQLDMGMQVLYPAGTGFYITAMPLDRRPPKNRRAVLLTRGQPR